MEQPKIFTTLESIKKIKESLKRYDWYQSSFENLKQQADEMLQRGFEVPDKKGYVFYTHCPIDSSKLIFDPFCPDLHICPQCGMNFQEEPYQNAWLCSYHHWLAQMAINLGIVFLITDDIKYAKAIAKILTGYVKHYPSYPNCDNELGPTKCFQSTYMESVWITNLVGAYDMICHTDALTQAEKQSIKQELFKVSANVIADYDEGDNNRQAFNNVALCAVGIINGDKELFNKAIYGEHGFLYHLNKGVLADGMWYEGDNYHFATVPSIVNIAEMCLNSNLDFYSAPKEGAIIESLFKAPLLSLQPDLTFPSRKDSGYGTLISQRWYAGLYELAYARTKNIEFGKILKVMYESKPEKFGKLSNAAGVMDIFNADIADRSKLDWRGFLTACPQLGDSCALPFNYSADMNGTGLAIIRTDTDNKYISLDYGHYGGGHGHPDRLQLSYFVNGRRWLTDYGTGQYYFDHLNWYRSTLSHNTVIVDGTSHLPVEGRCLLFETTSQYTIAHCAVNNISAGVNAQRIIVAFNNGLLFDCFDLSSDTRHNYQYLLHSFGRLDVNAFSGRPYSFEKEEYRFLINAVRYDTCKDLKASFVTDAARLDISTVYEPDTAVYTATAYGPPTQITKQFPIYIIEKSGESKQFLSVIEEVKAEDTPLLIDTEYNNGIVKINHRDGSFYIEKLANGWKIYSDNKNNQFCNIHNIKSKDGDNIKADSTAQQSEIGKKIATVRPASKEEFFKQIDFEGNIILNSLEQTARAEGHWRGVNDLSASALIAANKNESLLINIKVTDDTANYTGGKFPYDNDSVQLYFDRRCGQQPFSSSKSPQIYALLVSPKMQDECAGVSSIGGEAIKTEKITVSSKIIQGGYILRLEIPFDCIGGAPKKHGSMGFALVVNDRDCGIRRDKQMIWGKNIPNERIYLKTDHFNPDRYGTILFDI